MVRASTSVGVLLVALFTGSALAQQPPPPRAAKPTPSAESMGVSLKGVRREAKDLPVASQPTGNGLRYDFIVDVLGKRPKIDFFRDFDLSTNAPVRWGGVTHQEILNAVTPLPFRSYMGGVDLLAVTRKK